MVEIETSLRPRGLGKRAWLTTWTLRFTLWTLGFFRIVRTKFVNRRVVPRKGAVILAFNHTSFVDVLFILAALRRQAIAIAMAELWQWPFVGWLVRTMGQIPVVRGDADSGKQAIESAEAVLDHNGLVGIFPEGKCVRPGEKVPYKPGVAIMAKKKGVPIIPAAIVGANTVLPLGAKRPSLWKSVRVTFGEPIDPDDFESVDDLLMETERRITALQAA